MTRAIDRVERADVYVVSAPIEPPAGVSIGLASSHEYVLVRVTDTAGRVGWGETYLLPGGESVAADLATLVLGQFPTAMRRHRAVLARTRASTYSQSAILIALDDLRARQLEVPLHELYGGPTRAETVAYAASQGYVHGEELENTWAREAQHALESGFSAIKLRVGRFPVEREALALARVREMLGPSIDMMVDGNGGYTMGQAVRMGRILSELNVRWFEEPLPQDGYRGYHELRRSLDVPLAGGEILETLDAALVALDVGAFDVLQPDVVICGGIESVLELARAAEVRGCMTVPHTSGGAIGIAATAHILAALDDPAASPATEQLLLEFGTGDNPWRSELFVGGLEPVAGKIAVPSGPGLGWDVDGALVERRAAKHLEVKQ